MAYSGANCVTGPAGPITIDAVDVGYLLGPAAIGVDGGAEFLHVDQALQPVAAVYTEKAYYLALTIAEVTLANLVYAWDEASGVIGDDDSSKNPSLRDIVITADGPVSTVRTWTLNDGVAYDWGELSYEKGALAVIGLKFKFVKLTSADVGTVTEI